MKKKNNFFKTLKFLLILLIVLELFVIVVLLVKPSFINDLFSDDYHCEKCNVIIILVDTLRKDHLGVYGYGRNTSPNIDEFAKSGFVFNNAVSQYPSTKASVASLFTSLYPSVHKTTAISFGNSRAREFLPDNLTTIAEFLKNNDFRTMAIIQNPQLHPIFNFNQGFDVYKMENSDSYVTYSGDSNVTYSAINILNQSRRNKPFFLYLHYLSPHSPYRPPFPYNKSFYDNKYYKYADFRKITSRYYNNIDLIDFFLSRNMEQIIALYDGEIQYVDYQISLILNALKEQNLFDNSLIIIIADHGEELKDHRGFIGHGSYLYDVLVNVPLIIKFPKQHTGSIVDFQVEIIDIFPTIADFLKKNITHNIQGRSIIPLFKGKIDDKPAFSEIYDGQNSLIYQSIRFNDYKFIFHFKDNFSELYDLRVDPKEQKHNFISEKLEITNSLKRKLFDWRINVIGNK